MYMTCVACDAKHTYKYTCESWHTYDASHGTHVSGNMSHLSHECLGESFEQHKKRRFTASIEPASYITHIHTHTHTHTHTYTHMRHRHKIHICITRVTCDAPHTYEYTCESWHAHDASHGTPMSGNMSHLSHECLGESFEHYKKKAFHREH